VIGDLVTGQGQLLEYLARLRVLDQIVTHREKGSADPDLLHESGDPGHRPPVDRVCAVFFSGGVEAVDVVIATDFVQIDRYTEDPHGSDP
jgi:hypothetical protein